MSNIEKINSEIKDYVSYVQKGGKLEPFLEDICLVTTELVGFINIKNFKDLFVQFKKGDYLELFRETENELDELAIIVKWNDIKIGYVPRNHIPILSSLMDSGKEIYAIIDDLLLEEPVKDVFIKTVKIKIFLKEQ